MVPTQVAPVKPMNAISFAQRNSTVWVDLLAPQDELHRGSHFRGHFSPLRVDSWKRPQSCLHLETKIFTLVDRTARSGSRLPRLHGPVKGRSSAREGSYYGS